MLVDYIAAKKVIAPAPKSMVGGASELHASSGARIKEAIALLVERARAGDDIRAGADPGGLLRALAGFTHFNTGPDCEASARRLIDILMDGLRSPRLDR